MDGLGRRVDPEKATDFDPFKGLERRIGICSSLGFRSEGSMESLNLELKSLGLGCLCLKKAPAGVRKTRPASPLGVRLDAHQLRWAIGTLQPERTQRPLGG